MNWIDAWGLSASDGETTNPTFFSVTKNFGFGIWDVGVSTVEGIIDIAKHPVETAKGLGYAVTHPIETGKGIWGAVTTSFTNFKEGNADVKARILGNVTGEIGLAVLTSKGIDKAAKTLKSSKFLKGTAKGWFGKGKRGKADVSPKTPIERRGDPIRTLGNTPTKINGRTYTGHALDLMQRDGSCLLLLKMQ